MIRSWAPVVVVLALLLAVSGASAQDAKATESQAAAAKKKAEALRKRIEEIAAARETESLRQAALATRSLELQREYEEYKARRAAIERASNSRDALRKRFDDLVKKREAEARLAELGEAARRALAAGDDARAAQLCRAAHRMASRLDGMRRAEALISRLDGIEKRLARIETLLGRIARSLER